MTTDEGLEYLKNKISLELKDVSTQQGFEIICKRLDEAEKENAELKTQIEKMKRCTAVDAKMKHCCNCRHEYYSDEGHLQYDCPQGCTNHSEWELKEE